MACAAPKPRMPIKPVVIVLDNGPIHVSKATSAALAERAHWLIVEWLPKYAPELNDIEIVWGGLEFRAKTPSVPTNLCLAGKKGLVVGIASEDSIAFGWGMFRAQGTHLAITFRLRSSDRGKGRDRHRSTCASSWRHLDSHNQLSKVVLR
jgi:hypothetical protein